MASRVVLAVMTGLIVWAIQANQPVHLSPDSRHYLHAAETWRETGDMLYWDWTTLYPDDPYSWKYPPNTTMTAWPPLYPALLAIGDWAGLTAIRLALWLDWLSVVALVVYSDRMLDDWHTPLWIKLAVWCNILTAPVMREHMSAVMTDLPFAALAWMFVAALVYGWRVGELIALAWGLTLLRYSGVSMLATGVICLWMMGRRRDAVVFGLIAPIPLGLILLRNYAESGTLMGIRVASSLTIGDVAQHMLIVLGQWSVGILFVGGVVYAAWAFSRAVVQR